MQRISILLLLFFCTTFLSPSQKVDSIKVEQSGDFIKIGYRIFNSNPGQIDRVKVLFSINGLRFGIMGKAGVSLQYVVFNIKQYDGYTGDSKMKRFLFNSYKSI